MADELCVIGLGLIGGSVLRAAVAAGWTAWGADPVAEPVPGFDMGHDVPAALTRAATADALIVLAVPTPTLPAVLRQVATHAPSCALTDVMSVKAAVADAVREARMDRRYVGGHPMAGRSTSGWAAGDAALFDGAAWVVCADDGLDVPTWRRVAGLALDCGAHVVPCGAAEHDAAVARISHLPHLMAAVLASVGADGGALALGLAAGSFRDGTRVARTRPELTRAMLERNRPALLTALDEALGRLGVARGALASSGSVAATIDDGHAVLTGAHGGFDIEDVDISDLAALRAAGHAGGVLRAL